MSHGILVVDDEPFIAGLLRDVLERRGFKVEISEGGEPALARAASGEFQLVVSDFAIPGMNGLEFARALGSRRPSCRVMIVSAFLDGETSEALSAEPNVVRLVRKPFDIFDLIRAVESELPPAPQAQDDARPMAY